MINQSTTVLTSENGTRTGWAARRLVLFEQARDAMGSSRRMGDVIGVDRRAVHHKLINERRLTDFELKLAADEIERMARDLDRLVADIRKVLP